MDILEMLASGRCSETVLRANSVRFTIILVIHLIINHWSSVMFKEKRYVLVCTNERESDHPKGSCANCGSVKIRERMKSLLEEKNLKSRARILATSCMDVCENGAVICVMPDNVWYGGVRLEDAEEIVEKHLENGEPVERLLIPEEMSGLSLFG